MADHGINTSELDLGINTSDLELGSKVIHPLQTFSIYFSNQFTDCMQLCSRPVDKISTVRALVRSRYGS